VARAETRHRWKSLAALAVLTALVAAVVLATLAGLRRTDTAFARLRARTGYPDVAAQISPNVGASAVQRIERLPEVVASWPTYVAIGQVPGPAVTFFGVRSGPRPPEGRFRPIVTAGRMYHRGAVGEIVVLENLAHALGIKVGDQLEWHGLSTAQFTGWGDTAFGAPGTAGPAGPLVHLTVVGVAREPDSLDVQGIAILGSPAFYRAYAGRVGGGTQLYSWLRPGARARSDFLREEQRLALDAAPTGGRLAPVQAVTTASLGTQVDNAVGVLTTGLAVFAAVAGVVGLVALAQSWVRHSARSSLDQRILATLGMTRAQRVISLGIPIAIVSGAGALLGAVGAVALSGLFPMGVAAKVEPRPGLNANIGLLVLGALGFAVIATIVAVTASARATRAVERTPGVPLHPSRVATAIATTGAPAPVVVGTRMALEPGRGRSALPVRSTFVAAIVAVTGIVAAFTFGASLDRLTNTPARYGWTANVAIETFDNTKDALIARAVANHEYRSVALLDTGQVRVGSASIDAYALDIRKGSMGFTMLQGRMPETSDEVAIGPTLQAELATAVGDVITVTDAHRGAHPLRVVGIDLAPGNLGDSDYSSYSSSVVLTRQAFDLTASAGGQQAVLIGYAPNTNAAQLSDRLARTDEVVTPVEPARVSDLGQLGGLPDFLIAFLALLGAVALAHALIATTRRRRSEFAVLRTVGFRTRQLRASVMCTAFITVTVGLLVGIPVGLAIGNTVWRAVAYGVDVARDTAIPWSDIALFAIPALVAVVALSAITAHSIVRAVPAHDLRTE
jgi:hypothetical protein